MIFALTGHSVGGGDYRMSVINYLVLGADSIGIKWMGEVLLPLGLK